MLAYPCELGNASFEASSRWRSDKMPHLTSRFSSIAPACTFKAPTRVYAMVML